MMPLMVNARLATAFWMLALIAVPLSAADQTGTVRLKATADAWISESSPREGAAARAPGLRLRNIQDLALLRFDAGSLVGREVEQATLHLHRPGRDRLRYIRISTVNQDWRAASSDGDGGTWLMADPFPGKVRPWAWPGSTVADVIMSSGNSIGCWAERVEHENGWISAMVSPQVVYSLALGDSDGLAIMDGGNPTNESSYISGAGAKGFEPILEVKLGNAINDFPSAPQVTAEPAPDRADWRCGAARIMIAPAESTFCWRLRLDGRPVERWRVKHPTGGASEISLEDIPPDRMLQLEVVAVSRGGQTSPPTTIEVRSSPALARTVRLEPIPSPVPASVAAKEDGPFRVWPLPALVKIGPFDPLPLCNDLGGQPEPSKGGPNAVWDGNQAALFGARGEYVSFQLCIANGQSEPLEGIRIQPRPLLGPGGAKIGLESFELYQAWYARNRQGKWQSAYCLPLRPEATLSIPQSKQRLPEQKNQSVHVDLYIPKDATPGAYLGSLVLTAKDDREIEIPLRVDVLDFTLPDRLSFWPELNGYRVPEYAHDYYRLAHQHRCVLNCFGWRPKVSGAGAATKVDWDQYDRHVGPLLSGEAFAENRRSSVPVECMYLPFEDSWPTPLSPETYRYGGHWPRRGEALRHVTEHYMAGPYIGDGLSQEYQDAFRAVQRQFIEHFAEKQYNQTEMQCFFAAKASHRVEFGSNVWWTTDEPCYWDDWLAVQFFMHLWTTGRGDADPRLWAARADIARPQWQGRTLNGLVDAAYYGAGGFSGQAMARRCQRLSRETGVNVRCYGSTSADTASNLQNIGAMLTAWLQGADAYQPWQTLGSDRALDFNDAGADGGAALLVPGKRFDLPVVGDLRLKALRDGQQLIEYLVLLSERRRLNRDQIHELLRDALAGEKRPADAVVLTGMETADENAPLDLANLNAWQLHHLRRQIAELLVRPVDRPVRVDH